MIATISAFVYYVGMTYGKNTLCLDLVSYVLKTIMFGFGFLCLDLEISYELIMLKNTYVSFLMAY